MKGSDNPLPSILINEAATDGSDFTNPAADYRRLFLGEDGALHLKDSAGTVTDVGAAGGDVATDAIWDAKGDLAGGTGANTAAKLTVGANDTILVAASGETTGMKWQRFPTFSGALAYHNTTQQVGASVTTLSLNSEDFDTDSYHDNSTNNSRMTVPATGYYFVRGSTQFGNAGTSLLGLWIDGATKVRGGTVALSTVSGHKNEISQLVYLTVGQYIELWAYQDNTRAIGDATWPEAMTSLSIFRVG